jgi:hypothetical protein
MTVWIYIVGNDGTIQRFPLARFERLMRYDENECLRRYAGKRVRIVQALLELEHRRPVKIIRLIYLVLYFDRKGQIDAKEHNRQSNLVSDMLEFFLTRKAGNVIDATDRFVQKWLRHRYHWEPTPEIESAIIDAIFGSG